MDHQGLVHWSEQVKGSASLLAKPNDCPLSGLQNACMWLSVSTEAGKNLNIWGSHSLDCQGCLIHGWMNPDGETAW